MVFAVMCKKNLKDCVQMFKSQFVQKKHRILLIRVTICHDNVLAISLIDGENGINWSLVLRL